jgi:hypothetical protein
MVNIIIIIIISTLASVCFKIYCQIWTKYLKGTSCDGAAKSIA